MRKGRKGALEARAARAHQKILYIRTRRCLNMEATSPAQAIQSSTVQHTHSGNQSRHQANDAWARPSSQLAMAQPGSRGDGRTCARRSLRLTPVTTALARNISECEGTRGPLSCTTCVHRGHDMHRSLRPPPRRGRLCHDPDVDVTGKKIKQRQ